MPIQISYLADHTAWLAKVSGWYQDEWGSLWEPDSFSGWFDVGVGHANYSALPLAFVAHRDGELLGAAGLDTEAFSPELQQHRGPWMTGLFAESGERSNDVKIMLNRQILEAAKHFGFERVITMCRVNSDLFQFEGRSWVEQEHLVLGGRDIFVLSMALQDEQG